MPGAASPTCFSACIAATGVRLIPVEAGGTGRGFYMRSKILCSHDSRRQCTLRRTMSVHGMWRMRGDVQAISAERAPLAGRIATRKGTLVLFAESPSSACAHAGEMLNPPRTLCLWGDRFTGVLNG